MDELSWRAKLAKSNINILGIDFNEQHTQATVYYEFMYHPKPGQTKWCKTYAKVQGVEGEDIFRKLSKETLSLRKELEG